jgi:hypothetical protein
MNAIRNRIDSQSVPMQRLNHSSPTAADRRAPSEINVGCSRNGSRTTVGGPARQFPEPASATAVLRVDVEAGRFHTTKELTDFVLELDRRMRESDDMAILEDVSPQQRHALSDLQLTNTRIEG